MNGNINPPFKSDEHIPFIATADEGNLIYSSFGEDGYQKFVDHVFAKFRIVICEHNFPKYPEYQYAQFKQYADEHHLQIIPLNDRLTDNPTTKEVKHNTSKGSRSKTKKAVKVDNADLYNDDSIFAEL